MGYTLLQAEGQLEADLLPEALEHYRHEYFQRPARKVLEAIADSQRAVVLGDPGSGKSSLLQYLALEWVEGKTEKLPLLIELREFAINPSANFLEFLHRGRGVDWQFDQHQLHQHLVEFPTLIMFDGLDEVFDRATQSTVINDIIRFSRQYPKAQVLVTSRIIGYNPEQLQHSGFRHFTIQSLNTDEIHEFIHRWYDLSMGSDPNKVRLKQRLQDAITNSKAISNLADNPLLLTMMAILNRRQELPRDRADLYDQASRVLLYHWDVDHKRLQLPMDAIGRREKQEMLRLIAYEMQAGEEGLKGNLISSDRLTRILTDYLRDQGFSEPREKANRLIQQLRERNFILCYRGADTYGFMHRTFLEYFCAVEIVHRFEKQRTLTFEQLRDEVFGQHWQDETWHEVLRVICGAIDSKFAGELIEFLLTRECDRTLFLGIRKMYFSPQDEMATFLKPEGLSNLLLAADCLSDVKNSTSTSQLENLLLAKLKDEIEQPSIHLTEESAIALLDRVARCFPNLNLLTWLQQQALHDDWVVRRATVNIVALYYRHSSITLPWLKELILQHRHQDLSHAAIWAIAENYKDDPELLVWFQQRAQQHKDWLIRRASMSVVFVHYKNSLNILDWLKSQFLEDNDWRVQCSALRRIVEGYEIYPDILYLVRV
ncbi:NACHT domain-containing protein [Leptothermofonsia sichuanensis E412]|uniref:NACHT domain-containing protein n=1 Tax=Leptothermofonsia sichuanensis TaxID=2917832 RepID=UPI001CA6309E|nr:NACHT domain-containing protein [Leptothermofonsia sichuanensis]QZZ22754.1 NACHT domain-containing protein [Leptothermofonsia sichuanensis E412]